MSLLPRSPVVQRIVVVTAGEVSSPTPSMLADYTAVYTLGEAPFTKYTTNGTSLVAVADETNIDALVATSAADEIAAAIEVYLSSVGSNGVATPNEQTGSTYTLTAQDMERPVWRNSSAANITVLPSTSIIPIGADPISILQIGTGVSSVVGDTGVTVISPVDKTHQLISRYSGCFVTPVGTNLWRVYGDLAPIVATPTWTVDPTISGTGVQGSNLTCSDGTYTGGASASRAWLVNGVANGSTGTTYAPGAGDVGDRVSCAVTITLNGLTATKITNEIVIVASGETKPQNTIRPTITGNNTVGSVVTIGVGTWTNTPVGTPGYTIPLKRDGTTIQTYTLSAATTTQTYTLAALDEGASLVATVTATNAAGTITPGADSLPFPVAGVPPVYVPGTASITPSVPIVGQVLTANPGTVTGATNSPVYDWRRNGVSVGDTDNQYTTQSGGQVDNVTIPTDVGKTLSCRVTQSNSWGSTTYDIPGVVVQAAAPPPESGVPFDNGIPDGGTVIYSGSLAVGARPVGMHMTQMTSSYGGTGEYGPFTTSDSLRVNAWRVFGNYQLYWNFVEPNADGNYNWTEWDKADAFWARSGIEYVQYNLHGLPSGYRSLPETVHGQWSMQLPNSQSGMNNFLTALCNRYPRIKMIEVANEVWTDNRGIGYAAHYWVPSVVAPAPAGEASLFTLMNWVLDWRNTYNAANPTRNMKVQAPSIPGTAGHAANILAVFDRYQALHGRLAEFDSFSIHCYNTDFTNVHLSNTSGLAELRAGLNARGLSSKEVRDGERGFNPGTTVSPARVYNTVVRELIAGCSGIDFFQYGSKGGDETNLGNPYVDASLKANGYEHAALLANTTITRVTTGAGTGVHAGKWRVEGTTGGTPSPSPSPSPSPPPPAPSPSPAAPALASSQTNYGTSGTAVGTVPSGVANGDKLILVVTLHDAAKTITNPSGWATPISSANTGTGGTDVRTQVYERTASSEPASYNITLSGSVPWTTTILRLTGSSTPSSDATAVQATGDEPTDPTTPSITTTGANRLLIAISGQRGGGGISWVAPVGWNLQDSAWQGFPSNLAVAWKDQASAGASGAVTFGSDGSSGDVWTAHLLAYKV